jgi:hypothetical protein
MARGNRRDPALAARFGALVAASGIEAVRLHIGLAKTGTTHLQMLLLRSGPALRAAGVLFPESLLGQIGDSGARGYRSAGHRGLVHILRGSGVGAEALVRFEAELAAAAPRVLLLSTETLSEPAGLGLAETLAASLAGREVTIIIYVRNPADGCESLYKELVTGGNAREDRPLAGEVLAELEAAADLRPILAAWRGAFPGARFQLASYEAARTVGLAADFAARVPELAGRLADEGQASANRSLGRGATACFRVFNAMTGGLGMADYRAAFSAFAADMNAVKDEDHATVLAPEARAAVTARWAEANAFVVADGLMDAGTFAGLVEHRPHRGPWTPLVTLDPAGIDCIIEAYGRIARLQTRRGTLRRVRALLGRLPRRRFVLTRRNSV